MTLELIDPALPPGWTWTTLGEVCTKPQYGWTTSAAGKGSLRLLRTTDITSGHIDWSAVPFCEVEPPEPAKYLLRDGDIVISRAGSVGFSFLVKQPPESVFASYLIRFRPIQTDEKYLSYYLQSPDYWRQISESKLGIAVQNVNATKLQQIRLPLAPPSLQRHIVDAIEAHFTRLDAAVAALKRVQANLKRYRAAVLKAACEGRLVPTEAELARAEGRAYEPASVLLQRILAERRARWEAANPRKKYQEPAPPDTSELPELPEGWCWARVKQVGRVQLGRQRSPQHHQGPYMRHYLRVANVFEDHIDASDVMEMNFDPVDFEKYRLEY
ncbi:MAG TPA: restriction endonuclease subunit S, partial [Caldilineaceae bacterium]|nr:restriction endonuclease subunit S [Caldilineaceae bacterium]